MVATIGQTGRGQDKAFVDSSCVIYGRKRNERPNVGGVY